VAVHSSGLLPEGTMSGQAADRRLAAILSADVVGYSRLMAEDEDATVRTPRRVPRRDRAPGPPAPRPRRGLARRHLLAEFPTATEAVACAVEIQGVVGVRTRTSRGSAG
jgi:class 3 adenylate cyclase